jgi:hypothetical protein
MGCTTTTHRPDLEGRERRGGDGSEGMEGGRRWRQGGREAMAEEGRRAGREGSGCGVGRRKHGRGWAYIDRV